MVAKMTDTVGRSRVPLLDDAPTRLHFLNTMTNVKGQKLSLGATFRVHRILCALARAPEVLLIHIDKLYELRRLGLSADCSL